MTKKGLILVEGHGELQAVHNLVIRLGAELDFHAPWAPPLRWKNLHQWESTRGGVRAGAEFVRTKQDVSALLIIRDEDDGCPAKVAPEIAANLRGLALPFPTAFVLLRPEYEVLFLPCLANMTSVGFPAGLVWDRDSWESKRDIKGWLSSQLPRGRSYKPTHSQPARYDSPHRLRHDPRGRGAVLRQPRARAQIHRRATRRRWSGLSAGSVTAL